MGPFTCPTALATRKTVESMPTMGANGMAFSTAFGLVAFKNIPMAMGASTTWMVLKAIPAASMGTDAPSRVLQSSGVMRMALRVVAVVTTDSAIPWRCTCRGSTPARR